MKYKVKITDTTTGESRIYDMGECEWEDHSNFWWTEGNLACDCNRGMSFDRAGESGKAWGDDDEDEDGPDPYLCGHSRYVVHHAIMEDGTIVPIDDAASEASTATP